MLSHRTTEKTLLYSSKIEFFVMLHKLCRLSNSENLIFVEKRALP